MTRLRRRLRRGEEFLHSAATVSPVLAGQVRVPIMKKIPSRIPFLKDYEFCSSRIFLFMFKNKKIISITFVSLILLGLLFYILQKIPVKETVPVAENIKTNKVVLEIGGQKYENEIEEETNVYDFMSKLRQEGKISFTEKNYIGMGKFIETINGIKGDGDQNWIYYVNGKKALVGVSNYKIKSGDIVSWKYEKNY